MVLINEKYLGPDIWPEAVDQTKDRENLIKRVWATKAHY